MAHKIMIVEDEALVALATEMVLTNFGFEVVGPVTNGLAAIEIFGQQHPDIVLLDINLRGTMDGCETATALRSQYGATIVFVTGQADKATRERAMKTCPAGYLVKPFSPDGLRTAIKDALPH